MPEETRPSDAPTDSVAPSAAPLAPAPSPAPRTADAPSPVAADDTLRVDRDHKAEIGRLQRRIKQLEDAQLSDSERLSRDRDEAFAERDAARTELRQYRAQAVLANAGALHPALLVAELGDVDLADDKAVKAVLSDIRKAYPALFRAANGSADGGARGSAPERPESDFNRLVRRAAGYRET